MVIFQKRKKKKSDLFQVCLNILHIVVIQTLVNMILKHLSIIIYCTYKIILDDTDKDKTYQIPGECHSKSPNNSFVCSDIISDLLQNIDKSSDFHKGKIIF